MKSKRLDFIRHSFSVHTLDQMTANVWDAYCALPVLSTYLGHRDVKSTEKYLRLTEESFNTITSALALSHTGVFPEVCYGKNKDLPEYLYDYFLKYLPLQLGASENTIKSYRDTFIILSI